jgi:hypothetical protein
MRSRERRCRTAAMGKVAGNRLWFCFSTDLEVEIHFVASSMEAHMRGSQAEAPAPSIQVPVGVVDRKKDMTETLTRRLQGHHRLIIGFIIALCKDTRWIPEHGVELKAQSQIIQ